MLLGGNASWYTSVGRQQARSDSQLMAYGWLNCIAYLASVDAQERWIAGATKHAYLLPEELLDNALQLVKSVREGRQWIENAQISDAERRAILAFGGRLQSLVEDFDDSLEWKSLVRSDSCWLAIRAAAQELLRSIGFDLRAWEQSEGLGAQ